MVRSILTLCLALVAGCAASTPTSAPAKKDAPAAPVEPAEPEGEPADPEAPAEPEASADAEELAIPHDMPPLDAPCDTRREFATGRVSRALEFAAKGCSADAECVQAARTTGCRGGCPSAVLETYAERYETLRESIDARVCEGYRDDGCPYATPRCAKGAPRCVEGTCTYAMASG